MTSTRSIAQSYYQTNEPFTSFQSRLNSAKNYEYLKLYSKYNKK